MVRICSKNELPPVNQVREYALPSGRNICIANLDGELFALDNVCPHRGGALGQGTVERGYVVCPWHGWQFDPETGVPRQDRHCKVDVHEVKIDGDDVLVSPEPVQVRR